MILSFSFVLLLLALLVSPSFSVDFQQSFVVNWAASNVKFVGAASQVLQLYLDNTTGSGFASKQRYLFGTIDMQIKLISGDSVGTVTAYYMSSEIANHDELDFEFLGNSTGQPYILQTNVFASGKGEREQRIYLWFDPSADFHTYSISWTRQRILFLVDGIPIRVFSNNEAAGVPYLDKQAVRVFSSIWNGDSWATRGGLDKINWANAPFVASYRNFRAAAVATTQLTSGAVGGTGLSRAELSKLEWVKKNYMVYDYCTDKARYPQPPLDCTRIV